MFKLIWVAVTMTAQGPIMGQIPETTKFKTEAECIAFAQTMTPRLADWVRGRINADWDREVSIRFRCEMDGNPA